MTAAFLGRAARIAESKCRDARNVVVAAACAWTDTYGRNADLRQAIDVAPLESVKRYDRLTARWLRLNRARAKALALDLPPAEETR